MAYNPNEPRDEHGRWTDGGGTAWSPLGNGRFVADKSPMIEITKQDKHFSEFGDLRALAVEVSKYAVKLGFDPQYLTVTDANHPFEVDGHSKFAAGTADREGGRITIYAPQVPLGAHWTPGLMAHEIMHQKFNAFMQDYQAEYARLQKDPDYHKDGEWKDEPNGDHWFDRKSAFMRPDGQLNEPYASKYPLYQTYNRVMVGSDEFRKSDGVSEYSKNWWTDVINGKASWDVGIHETLAEMAKIKLNEATNLKEHKERVKDMRARGVEWSEESEKLFKKNSGTMYRFYKEGKEEVDGKKVYFATTGKRVAKVWSALYDAVTEHWDSRHKYKAPKK